MNERPTPETDQFKVKLKTTCGEKYWVPVEHSERLERERDEAREKLSHLRACVFDALSALEAGAFEELKKAWEETK